MKLTHFRPNMTSNWALALASFFIAFAIWTIAKEGELTEQTLEVPIRLEAPPYAQLTVAPKTVRLHLRYPVSQVNLLHPEKLYIELGMSPGGDPRTWAKVNELRSRVIALEPRMAILADLPQSFQAVQIQPDHAEVTGMLIGREAFIEPDIVGKPGAGYAAGKALTQPASVTLIGAQEDLNKLPRSANNEATVSTSEVDIGGHTSYFETKAEIQVPPDLELLDAQNHRVTVIVPISPAVGQRTLSGIPITSPTFNHALQALATPATASVRIEGPVSLLNALGSKDFSITPREPLEETLDAQGDLALDCQFNDAVSPQVRDKVSIVTDSLTPRSAYFHIVRAGSKVRASDHATSGTALNLGQ